MEFSINRAPSSASHESDTSNDRLRKAIERNRSKQARGQPPEARATAPSSHFGNDTPVGNSAGIPNEWSSPAPASPRTRRPQRAADPVGHGRRSVAGLNHQEQQIIEPTVRRALKAPAVVKYATPKKTVRKKKRSKVGSVGVQRLVKGSWLLCLVLFVRLIFTDGGIIDYYSTNNLLELKSTEVSSVKNENESLIDEIQRIRKDKSYQKKLVRDNLGFISKNEYLVLFPK